MPRPGGARSEPDGVPAAIDTFSSPVERRDFETSPPSTSVGNGRSSRRMISSPSRSKISCSRDRQDDVEVARRGRRSGPRRPRPVSRRREPVSTPGRDLDRQLLLAPPAAFPAAARAGLVDHAPVAAAGPAGPHDRQEPLGEPLAPGAPAAPGKSRGRDAGSAAPTPLAVAAALEPRDRDRRLHAERGVPKRDLHPVDEVASGRRDRTAAPPKAAAAKPKMPLKRSEKSPKAEGSKPAKPPRPPAPAPTPGVPELVVARPLLGIRQHGVGLGRFAELLGRVGLLGLRSGW